MSIGALIGSARLHGNDRARESVLRATVAGTMTMTVVVVSAGIVAVLVASGAWYLALAALCAVPGLVMLYRSPMLAVTMWIVLTPLVAVSDSAVLRQVFWLVHRGVPLAAVVLIILAPKTGSSGRTLPRLGLPEALMAAYVGATLLSIAYTSQEGRAQTIDLYDFVIVPMLLYLIIRLRQPTDGELRQLTGAVLFLLLTQCAIGLIAWSAPGALPSEWLGKLGERTVGSLRSPDVYGTTVLFAGVFLLHAGVTSRRSARAGVAILLFLVAVLMDFMTFSRASWLAGVVVVAGALCIYRAFLPLVLSIVLTLGVVAAVSGVLEERVEYAQERLDSPQSQESALSRLPVVYASLRMFGEKPVAGWGYQNFDRFDRQFQRPVGNLFYPDKDHASHNSYLTILAEQGVVGIVLFLGPMVCWLARSGARARRLPVKGFANRRFVGAMWLVLAAHLIVNNFSRMQVSFGLGMWWLVLGMIAVVVDRVPKAPVRMGAEDAR